MRMWIAWVALGVLMLPLFVGAGWGVLPSVDPVAKAQRIVMMSNQVTQITTLTQQLTELRDQFQHIQDATIGQVQPLTEPFTRLTSETTGLVSDGMAWKSQFSGVPGQLADAFSRMGGSGSSLTTTMSGWLRDADTVSEADIVDLHADQPPDRSQRAVEAWRHNRERAESQIVMNHTVSDASEELIKALKETTAALERMQNQTNLSDTALAQAQVSTNITQGNLIVGLAQLQAYQAAKEAAKDNYEERERRRMIDDWNKAQKASKQNLQARIAAIEKDHDRMRQGLLLKVHDAFRDQPRTP